MLTAFPLPWHSPLHPQTGHLSWERVSARARCPHLPGKASCRLSSVSVGLSPETVQFLVVSDDLGAVMYLQHSKGEWNSWAYPHARKDCLGFQKSENKVDVSVVTGMKVLFLSCLLLLLLLTCIPPCTLCESSSELVLCAHGVCTRWHSIAFAPYTGVCNQAHGVSTAAPVEVRAPDVLGVSLTGISNPKQGAVLSSSCAVGFVLSVWLRGLDPFWIGGLGEVSPSSQEVSAGPGLSDGSSFVLQTHLLGSWGCLRRGTSNPGWCCCSSRLHWTGF